MTAIVFFPGVAIFRDTNGDIMYLPRVRLTMYLVHTITLGDTIIPSCAELRFYPSRTNDLTRPPAMVTAENKKQKQKNGTLVV